MTHPHDVALLNDLVDDRLTPAAADDLRRRLADEPALAAAYAELRRMRAALAAMPVPVVAPPDFLARVRARAGLPPVAADRAADRAAAAVPRNGAAAAPPIAAPSVPAAPAPAPADGGPDSSGEGASPSPRGATGGRVFALSRFAVPLAAGIGLVLGAGLYAALRTDRAPPTAESARNTAAPATAPDAAAPQRKLGPRAGTDAKDASVGAHDGSTWQGGEGDPAATGAAAGAKPSGAQDAPPGPDVAEADKRATPGLTAPVTGGAGGGPGGVGGGGTVAPRFRTPGGAVPEGLRRPSDVPGAPTPPTPGTPPVTAPAPSPADAPPTAPTAPAGPIAPPPTADAGAPATGGRYGSRTPSRTADAADGRDAPETDGADAASRRAGWARAAEGVDAVVVVRASSVDEARAQLALLTVPGTPGLARGGPESVARDGEPAHRVLGSFVAELTPEAFAALTAVRPEAAELLDHDRAAREGAGDREEPASPDEAGAREKAAAGEAARLGAPATPRPGAATATPPAGSDGRAGTRGAPVGGTPSPKPGEPGAARGAAKKASPEPGTDPAAPVPPPASPPATPRKGDAPPPAAVPPPPAPPTAPSADDLAKTDGASDEDEPVVRRVRVVVVPR